MNDEASLPEGEKPRYLLPDGCRDLIDALRLAKSESRSNLEPGSVPMGLSRLASYVEQVLHSKKANDCLIIACDSRRRLIYLTRYGGLILLHYRSDREIPPDRHDEVRAFAAQHSLSLTPAPTGFVSGGGVSSLAFKLPPSSQAVTALCREVLMRCLEVQPEDRLVFDIFNVG